MHKNENKEDFLMYLMVIFGFVVFFTYSWVTITSPIAFGDEGFYSSMGRWISEHFEFPKYYPLWGTDKIHTSSTRVPMGFVNSALFYMFFGEAGIKIMMPFFIFLTFLVTISIFKRLGKPIWGYLTGFVFLTLPATVKYGVLNYPENQMILYASASFLFFFLGKKEKNIKWYILSGIFSYLALFSDITGVFIFGILFFYLLARKFKDWKEIGVIYFVSGILYLPWIIRNFVLYKNPCIPSVIFGKSCGTQYLLEPLVKINYSTGHSNPLSLFQTGLLHYLVFGFGLTSLILFISLPFLWEKRRKFIEKFTIVSLLTVLLINVYLLLSSPRIEELLRYSLFSLLIFSITLSVFLKEIYENIKTDKKDSILLNSIILSLLYFVVFVFLNKLSGIIFISSLLYVIIFVFINVRKEESQRYLKKDLILSLLLTFLLLSFVHYGGREIVNMHGVKHNLDSLVEACQWAQTHLPENATIALIYAHPAEYNCYRKITAIQDLPDSSALRLFANDTSYEILKRWGIDYVIIEGFTISFSNELGESEPIKFVNYLENSDKFEKIYDQENKPYFQRIRIFKVK